jgi:hypothetical protein
MIKTDFTTVKVALGAPAKSAMILLLEMGVPRRRMVGGKYTSRFD